MTDTEPNHSQAIETIRRHPALRIVLVILPGIVTSLAAYTGASSDARSESALVKDKAESGYQVAKNALEELRESNRKLQERLQQIEADLAAIKRSVRAVRSRPITVTVKVPPPPAALPATLDKAREQIPPPPEDPPK